MDLLLVVFSVGALLTRIGFALYAIGLVRAKNSAATAMRLVGDLCVSVLAFWAIGAAIQSQTHNSWFSVNVALLFGRQAGGGLLFYTVVILMVTAAVSGAVAERCGFVVLCLVSLVLAGLVLPVAWNWAWIGWLGKRGFIDFAGGTWLHVAVGAFATVACLMVGSRSGKFNRDGSSSMIPGHNLPMASVGVLVMLAGWIPYVAEATILRSYATEAGTSAGVAAINVLLASAAAGLAGMAVSHVRYGKPDVVLTLFATLGGMVSICAGAACLPLWGAVITGCVAGIIVPLGVGWIDLQCRIDDPLGIISIHGIAGAWGTIAVGFYFALPVHPANTLLEVIGLHVRQMAIQLVGVVAVGALSALVAAALFSILKSTVGLKLKEVDDFDGLDLAQHDIGAYPDFQQNTIKSYHLRET